ncbi:hypothetical protein BDZ89DRAFT_1046866 [Hymenopellis radicata]|nr:hypothetical protein BDZ89DRAFT_1046866 [Hymenopellis radicata]
MSKANSQYNAALLRGQACIHCRRRKMRCDGARPVCTPCSHTSTPEDCEYTDKQGRSRSEILEENIARVEARIYELEHPEAASAEPVYLHYPYLQRDPVPEPGSTGEVGWFSSPEPPMEMRPALVDHFLSFASEVGFFLNPARFRAAALGTQPAGHPSRPIPALLTAAYLWGIHFSGTQALTAYANVYLSRAVSQVSTALSTPHPHQVIQTIQAEFLLASYFFACGRFLEGKYALSTGMSIGIVAGFMKIRSSNPPENDKAVWSSNVDAITEGERVEACWGGYAPHLRTSSTVRKYLNGSPRPEEIFTPRELCSAEQSFCGTDMSREESDKFFYRFAALDGLLERLKNDLTPPDQLSNRTPSKLRALFVTHSVTYAGFLQLHVLGAALTIFRMVSSIHLGSRTHFINPILGTIWIMASKVLFDDLAAMKAQRSRSTPPLEKERELQAVIEDGLRNMQPLSRSCVLMRYQLHQIQEAYSAI